MGKFVALSQSQMLDILRQMMASWGQISDPKQSEKHNN